MFGPSSSYCFVYFLRGWGRGGPRLAAMPPHACMMRPPTYLHDLLGPMGSGRKPLTPLEQTQLCFLLLFPVFLALTHESLLSLKHTSPACTSGPLLRLEPCPQTFKFTSSLLPFLLQCQLLRKASWVHPTPKGT